MVSLLLSLAQIPIIFHAVSSNSSNPTGIPADGFGQTLLPVQVCIVFFLIIERVVSL